MQARKLQNPFLSTSVNKFFPGRIIPGIFIYIFTTEVVKIWQSENYEGNNKSVISDYKKILKKAKKGDSNSYMLIQVFFSAVIILVSFMLKNESRELFSYAKENYQQFFETENYKESTFSYEFFIESTEKEIRERFNQLAAVFNSKGKADIIPANASTEKYYMEKKGTAPAAGYISSPYGVRKNPFNPKEKEFHTGLDIAAPKGTFIKAAFSGTVKAAGYSAVAGNYIRIESDNKIETLYAHNQFLLVKVNDTVVAGQVIATMGETGMATGPHVHFEFLSDGVRYNPIYAIEL